MMKSLILSLTVALAALTVSTAKADTVVTTAPGVATYSGVVTKIDPTSKTMILTSPSVSAPVTYTYTPQTVFLDSEGNTVSYQSIRNVPVTIEYDKTTDSHGNTMVVRRVIATAPIPAPAP